MNKEKIKKNIKFVFSILLFAFGLGLIIGHPKAEIKLFGLIFMSLSINSY